MTEQHEPTHEERVATVGRAISAAFPGEYVDGWLVITHRLSTELEQQGLSVVSTLVPDEQSWVLTRGMLAIASDGGISVDHPPHRDEDD